VALEVVAMESKLLAVFTARLRVNVTELSAELGISRQTFYKYRRQFQAEGPSGLVARSRAPGSSPNQTAVEVEDEIVRIRKSRTIDNGARAIAYELAATGWPCPSVATIHRVLVRRGMVVAEPAKRPHRATRRFEWPRPNDAWQIDATCWALADGRNVWIMDVLDDHSRVLIAARACDGPTGPAAWDAFMHGIARWGIPAHVMSDNGRCFTGRFCRPPSESDFERSLRSLGVVQICSSPAHPQTCGKLERHHRTMKRWLTIQPPAATLDELQADLDRWQDHYNEQRPHSVAHGKPPGARWRATPPASPGPALPGPITTGIRTIDGGGKIAWHNTLIQVDGGLAGTDVLVIARDADIAIHGQHGLIRRLTLDRTRRYQPNGRPPGRRPRHEKLSAMS
jgi:transposase InsO family protein